MKKIYLSILTIALGLGMSFGQFGYDVEVTLTTPAPMSTKAPTTSEVIEFTLTNNGPDAIPEGSIVWISGLWIAGDMSDGGPFSLDDGTPNGVNGLQLPFDWTPGMELPSSALLPAFPGLTEFTFNTSNYPDGTMVGVSFVVVGEDLTGYSQQGNDDNPQNDFSYFIIGSTSDVADYTIEDFKVYPNPATSVVNFEVDGVEGNVNIFSITGETVISSAISNSASIDVSELNNGIYIYTITDANNEVIKTDKLVIRR